MRLIGYRSKARLSILFIVGIVSFEPDNLAVTFKGEDVRGCSI